MTWRPDEHEMLACELAVAKSLCPGFDSSAPDAWRVLIYGMVDNKAIHKELQRLDPGGGMPRDRFNVYKDARIAQRYSEYEATLPGRGSRKSRLQGFRKMHPEFKSTSDQTLLNAISRGTRVYNQHKLILYEIIYAIAHGPGGMPAAKQFIDGLPASLEAIAGALAVHK